MTTIALATTTTMTTTREKKIANSPKTLLEAKETKKVTSWKKKNCVPKMIAMRPQRKPKTFRAVENFLKHFLVAFQSYNTGFSLPDRSFSLRCTHFWWCRYRVGFKEFVMRIQPHFVYVWMSVYMCSCVCYVYTSCCSLHVFLYNFFLLVSVHFKWNDKHDEGWTQKQVLNVVLWSHL